LREQLKILSEEVALHKSVLKRLIEGAGRSTMNGHVEVIFLSAPFNMLLWYFLLLKTINCIYLKIEMKKVSDEIKDKQQQIAHLERQIKGELDQLEHTPVYYLQSISFQLLFIVLNCCNGFPVSCYAPGAGQRESI
jgi:centromeric protein E